MANFDRGSGIGGAGFDSAAYALNISLDSRRSVALVGGGPSAERLTVGAADPSKLRMFEADATRDGNALPANTREFWIDGIGVGTTTVYAKLAGGADYAKALTVNVTTSMDKQRMVDAYANSRDALVTAVRALQSVQSPVAHCLYSPPSIRLFNRSSDFNALQERVMTAVAKWLNVKDYNPRLGPTECKMWATEVLHVLGKTIELMKQNLDLRMNVFVRIPEGVHAQVRGGEFGVECGEPFFTVDGPHCRRDVLTHELFHQLGVGHGIDPLSGPTIHRFGITPTQSLNSADNLAQLVADIVGARTDCCTRKGD
jgi:hypothetical protein